MNLTRYGLLAVVLVGTGAPGLISYARNQQIPRLLKTAYAPALAPAPQSKVGRIRSGSRSQRWQAIRADLFSGAAQAQPIAPHPPATPPAETALPVAPVATPALDPLADYAYTGTVTVDSKITALVEQRKRSGGKTREGWYVHEGDLWQNYHILSVNEREITIGVNDERHTLTKTDAVNVVPLIVDAGQSASDPGAGANQGLHAALVASMNNESLAFQLSGDMITSTGLSEAEIAHIKDDAFEGRISAEEADRRLNQGKTINPPWSTLQNTQILTIEDLALY